MFFLLNVANAQTYLQYKWFNTIDGVDANRTQASVVDDTGNVYSFGFFEGITDFDPSINLQQISPQGNSDAYILKLDSVGNFVWVKTLSALTFGSVNPNSICLDSVGNIFVCGNFIGSTDFDPGPGSMVLNNSNGGAFVCKLDPSGNFVWAKNYGAQNNNARGVACDIQGNVFVTGNFNLSGDFDPGPGSTILTPLNSTYDVYLLKLDDNGNLVWIDQFKSSQGAQARSVTIDPNGNCCITGLFSSTIDADPGLGTTYLPGNTSSSSCYVIKVDVNGSLIWANYFKSVLNNGNVSGLDIITSPNADLYITGEFMADTEFDSGSGTNILSSNGGIDIFVAKLNSSGILIWAKGIGGVYQDESLSIDYNTYDNTIAFVGWITGTVDCDPGTGTAFYGNNVGTSGFVASLNSDGNFNFAKTISGNIWLVGVDSHNGNLNVTGWYSGNMNTEIASYSAIVSDGLCFKIGECIPSFGAANIVHCDSYTWIDGNTYDTDTTGVVYYLTNLTGCDSIVTLNLTITNSSSTSESVITCDSFIWPANGNNYTLSGVYTDTLSNLEGCDSIVTLYLTIHNSNTGYETITSCVPYTWPANGNIYSATGVYTTLLSNSAGCDSLVTLNLFINSVSDNTTSVNGITLNANNSNASYAWLDCDNDFEIISGETNQTFSPEVNGNYAVQLLENGCVDTSECVAITTIGISENMSFDDFILFPNPTVNSFSILFNTTQEEVQLKIMDVSGRLINQKYYQNIFLIEYHLDQPIGTYLVELSGSDNQRSITRMIKQ